MNYIRCRFFIHPSFQSFIPFDCTSRTEHGAKDLTLPSTIFHHSNTNRTKDVNKMFLGILKQRKWLSKGWVISYLVAEASGEQRGT